MYRKIHRGDIYTCNFGNVHNSVQGGFRPCYVLKGDNKKSISPIITVAPITSQIKDTFLPSHLVMGTRFHLDKDSMIEFEQTTTVPRSNLVKYIGSIDTELLPIIQTSFARTFGLNMRKYDGSRYAIIKCLCSDCKKKFQELQIRKSISIKNGLSITEGIDNTGVPISLYLSEKDKMNGIQFDYDAIARFKNDFQYDLSKNQFVLRRVEPLQKKKSRCEVCFTGFGYDYFIIRKSDANIMRKFDQC